MVTRKQNHNRGNNTCLNAIVNLMVPLAFICFFHHKHCPILTARELTENNMQYEVLPTSCKATANINDKADRRGLVENGKLSRKH